MLSDVSQGTARSNAKSSQDGTNDKGFKFKVRYAYAPAKFDDESREFCKEMVQAGKIYRKEDIMAMSSKAVNPGWGEGGANTYDIWLYKGGPNCYHKWTRVVYFRKRNTDGTFMPNKGLTNDKVVSEAQAKSQGFEPAKIGKAGIAPKDMPNQGYATSKKNRK